MDETLHPELAECVTERDGFRFISHPLVQGIYSPGFEALFNDQLRAKTQLVRDCASHGNWHQVIWLHERPYRPDALLEIRDLLMSSDYWRLVREVWIDTEMPHTNAETWRRLLIGSDDPANDRRWTMRRSMMTPEERDVLRDMPATIDVWRGSSGNETGFSWTTSEETALWFAERFGGDEIVTHGLVEKPDVIAYLEGRGEFEILVLPEDVREP